MTPPWLALYFAFGWVLRAVMIAVILRRQFAPGAAMAWLGIIFLHPYIGLALYLLVGENRLGPRRAALHKELIAEFRSIGETDAPLRRPLRRPQQLALHPAHEGMVRQAERISFMPVLGGNAVDFLAEAGSMIDRLVADIDAARSSVHLLYYILACDTNGRRVLHAVAAAARRGVPCRILADAFASRAFLRTSDAMQELSQAGVKVVQALPTSPLRRRDLRNHRKLSVIDGQIGYVGSHNLINPDYGGRHGGPWVDLTGRFTGPVVGELAIVFAEDWAFETREILEAPRLADLQSPASGIPMQVVPTGPTSPAETYRRVLLAAIQSARTRLILTTPYFVPDETTLVDLMMAADRGVEVTLVLPQTPDHFFAAAAGRAHYRALLQAGVAICLYRPGLIHAKTATVDNAFCIFGSANLDVRSFNLNFELSTILYGADVTERLRTFQLGYIKDSIRLDPQEWSKRPVLADYADSAVSLLSPLL